MKHTKENIFYNWVMGNIFGFKKFDSALYIVFYVTVSITVTAWSLYAFPTDIVAGAYLYLTVLISALNCLYDAINRWHINKSIVNVKLVIIMLSVSVVLIYCLIVVMSMLITKTSVMRDDRFFCAYFVVVAVALFDLVGCVSRDLTIKEYT